MFKNGVYSLLDSNGDELFYRVYGHGRPVFLLHGFGMNNLHWFPFLWSMRKTCQFILPDLRGFGLSKNSYKNYQNSLVQHADDVHTLISHLKLDEATLAGYSLGALISMQYLQKYGSNGLKDIVIIDAQAKLECSFDWKWPIFHDNYETRFSTWRRLAHSIHSNHGHSEYNTINFNSLDQKTRIILMESLGDFMSDAVNYEWTKNIIKIASGFNQLTDLIFPLDYWHVFFDHALSFIENDYDFRTVFQEIEIPVSLISGNRSRIFPIQAQKHLIESCSTGNHIILNNSGHLLMFDQPILFTRALNKTLGI